MKSSPLLLRWINYPVASYEALEDFRGGIDALTPVAIEAAEINYSSDGEHMALLRLSSDHSLRPIPYRFAITVVASFGLDAALVRQEYRVAAPERLASIVAVNVARVLFSGARDYIAMLTARSTFGCTYLESQLIEPIDVKISSDVSPAQILSLVFGLSEEEIEAANERVSSRLKSATDQDKSKKRAKTSQRAPQK